MAATRSINWRARLLALTLGVAVAPVAAPQAGSAAAGPPSPWSTPKVVPGTAAAHLPQVLFAPGGAAALLWSGPPAQYDGASWVKLVGDQLGGTPTQIVGQTIFQTQIEATAAVGSGNSVILPGNAFAGTGHASIVTGTLGGPVAAPVALSRRQGLSLPVAANASGRFALIVGTAAGAQLITGRIGAPHRHAVDLPRARGTVAAVAIDKQGDALAAWEDARGRILTRLAPARGRPSPARVLGAANGTVDLHAILTDRGRAVVAWASERVDYFQSCDCNRIDSPATFRAAIGDRTGRFGRELKLGSFTGRDAYADIGTGVESQAAMAVAIVGRSQQVVIGWRQLAGRVFVARLATGPTFATRRDVGLAGHNVQLDSLLAGPRGELLALLSAAPATAGSSSTGQAQLFSACARTGLSFNAPETMSAPGPVSEPGAAFDPRTDVAVAAWVAHDPLNGSLVLARRAPGC